MDNNSILVRDSQDSSIRSALVNAIGSWTTPYSVRPSGMFGSIAIVKCGNLSISSEKLDLEFTVPFDDDMEPNEAEIVIYNIEDSTIAKFKMGSLISIEAGYGDDTGVLFEGYITKVKTRREDGIDKVTTIKAMDDIKNHTVESISFAAGTQASYILKTLLDRTGIPIAVFTPRRDHTYVDSQTVDGDLMANIKKYATVCGISAYVNKGKIYARHKKEGDNFEFYVDWTTGLIGTTSDYTEEIKAEDFTETVNGYEAEMLLQHRISTGAIVRLNSKNVFGDFRVCSGEHRFSEFEAITKIKVY